MEIIHFVPHRIGARKTTSVTHPDGEGVRPDGGLRQNPETLAISYLIFLDVYRHPKDTTVASCTVRTVTCAFALNFFPVPDFPGSPSSEPSVKVP